MKQRDLVPHHTVWYSITQHSTTVTLHWQTKAPCTPMCQIMEQVLGNWELENKLPRPNSPLVWGLCTQALGSTRPATGGGPRATLSTGLCFPVSLITTRTIAREARRAQGSGICARHCAKPQGACSPHCSLGVRGGPPGGSRPAPLGRSLTAASQQPPKAPASALLYGFSSVNGCWSPQGAWNCADAWNQTLGQTNGSSQTPSLFSRRLGATGHASWRAVSAQGRLCSPEGVLAKAGLHLHESAGGPGFAETAQGSGKGRPRPGQVFKKS